MPEGTVVKFDEESGRGTILPDGEKKEIFVHREYFKDRSLQSLKVGQRVRFVKKAGYRAPKAKDVEIIRGQAKSPPASPS